MVCSVAGFMTEKVDADDVHWPLIYDFSTNRLESLKLDASDILSVGFNLIFNCVLCIQIRGSWSLYRSSSFLICK